jgi:hypothetical protein
MAYDTTQPSSVRFNGRSAANEESVINSDVNATTHRVVRLLAVCCLGLIPWTIGLAVTLPRSYLVANWPLAWTGFDVILLGCLATTAWALHKQRHVAVPASITTSVLLFCDAWFDILTAHGGLCRTVSIATAILTEIPLALMLGLISSRLLRSNAGAGASTTAHSSIWRTPLSGPGRSASSGMRTPSDDSRNRTRIERTRRSCSMEMRSAPLAATRSQLTPAWRVRLCTASLRPGPILSPPMLNATPRATRNG